LPIEIFAEVDGVMIESATTEFMKNIVHHVGMCNRSVMFEQRMEHLAALDISLNKIQSGSGFSTNSNTTTKVSARKIDSNTGGTTHSAGTAKDNS